MSFWTAARERSWKWPSLAGRHRRLLPLLCGILLAGGSLHLATTRMGEIRGRVEAATTPTEVVVAATAIRPGDTLGEANLAKAALPACAVGRRHVPAGDYLQLLGSTARACLEPGDPILRTDAGDRAEGSHLSGAIPPGRRAVTLPVDPSSTFGDGLRPGDRVDLLCSDGSGGAGTTVLLEAVPVLAVGGAVAGAAAENGGPGSPSTATLSLDPGRLLHLLRALRGGTVQWSLRNGSDNGVAPSPRPVAAERPPEIWEGGVRCDRRPRS